MRSPPALALVVFLALVPDGAEGEEAAPTALRRVVHEILEVPRRSEDGTSRPPIVVGVWAPAPANSEEKDDDAQEAADPERLPLFFFSHGFGGSGGSYSYLTERIAAAGWIVVAPDHADEVSVARLREEDPTDGALEVVRAARDLVREPFSFERYRYRLDESREVLDAILRHDRYGSRIDGSRIVAGGHSFGGYTTLGLAGAIEGRRDERIDAVVLLSPGLWMYGEDDFARVQVPTLYLLGEHELAEERGAGTKLDLSRLAHASFSGRTYLYALVDGRHLSFSDRGRSRRVRRPRGDFDHDAIVRIVQAFLDESVGRGEGELAKVARETGRLRDLAPPPDDGEPPASGPSSDSDG